MLAAQNENEHLISFLKFELTIVLAFLVSAILLGRSVQKYNWNANYTRKLLGAVLLLTPLTLVTPVYSPQLAISGYCLFLICLLLLAKPVRDRVPFLATAFAAIDRPEDRPYTLTWFITAYIASAIIVLLMVFGIFPTQPAFVAIAVATVAIGDLLAGAIGYRFGKHRYKTRALFTSKTYTRSWEGSACVFLTAVVAVLVFSGGMPMGQFVATLVAMPVILTLVEAWSPHTWDEPVMFLAALGIAWSIVHVVPIL
jgi:dolichol kinase